MKKYFFYFFLVVDLCAQEVQIIFSHSLNGNLLSCPCAVVPIAGISRRASFFEKNFSPNSSIFIELGNFFSSSDSFEKKQAILEAFQTLGYLAVVPSKEWEEHSIEDWKNLKNQTLVVSNVKEKGFFQSRELFSEKKVTKKYGKSFVVYSLLSEKEFSNISQKIQKNYQFINPKNFIQSSIQKENYDYLLLVLIGDVNHFPIEEITNLKNKILFLSPTQKVNLSKPFILHPKLGNIYTTRVNFGNELGVIQLNLANSSEQEKLIVLDVENLLDSPNVKKIIDKYGVK
jgi:hypothetical protein